MLKDFKKGFAQTFKIDFLFFDESRRVFFKLDLIAPNFLIRINANTVSLALGVIQKRMLISEEGGTWSRELKDGPAECRLLDECNQKFTHL